MAALDRQFRALVSVPLLLEYEAVLKRSEHLAASGLNEPRVERLLDDLVDVAVPAGEGFRWRMPITDVNDVMVLEAALNGGADAIVTFNVRHFVRASKRYRVRIIRPRQALREMREDRQPI
jgi:predicted nucleic acid-binding protein